MTTVAQAPAATPYQYLNRARHSLRSVQAVTTERELAAVREINRLSRALLTAYDEQEQVLLTTALSERTTRCLWCSREAPSRHGSRCGWCNGPWYSA